MKYIKKYEREEIFEESGNTLGYEFMLEYEFPYRGGVLCSQFEPYEDAFLDKQPTRDVIYMDYGPFKFMGSVDEVTPGVCYCEAERTVYYNRVAKLPEITVTEDGEYTWDELGITDELFNTYLKMFNENRHAIAEYNIKPNEPVATIFMYPRNGETEYLQFNTRSHYFKVNRNERTVDYFVFEK